MQYKFLKKYVVGYELTAAKPADWEENWTAYFINEGTADNPSYTPVSSETAPEWMQNTYYSFSAAGKSSFVVEIPACYSVLAKLTAKATSSGSVTVNASAVNSTNYKNLPLIVTFPNATSASADVTSLIYLYAGCNLPFAIYQVGSGALTLKNGRVGGVGGGLAVELPCNTEIKYVRFTASGFAGDTAVELYGCPIEQGGN